MKRIFYALVVGLTLTGVGVSAQFKVQYGFSVDARIGLVFKYVYLSNFRLSASAGAGAVTKHTMPYLQYTLATFQGGLGSSFSKKERKRVNLESRVAMGILLGGQRSNTYLHERGIDTARYSKQVYTMGFLNSTPLRNPYTDGYLGLATNFIFRPNDEDLGNFGQAVGSFSAGGRYWDIHYYNDGPPFNIIPLGDGKDRYYTGGGFASFLLKNKYDHPDMAKNEIRRFFIGFDRFTGFFPHAYEAANRLGFKRVPYKDEQQSFYNKGRFYGGVEFAGIHGLTAAFAVNDSDYLDIQNVIHSLSGYPWHTTLHKWSFGADVFYNYQNRIGPANK